MIEPGRKERQLREVERLLRYPQVGPLSARAIAKNLGATPEEIQPILDSLSEEGRIRQTQDGRFAAAGSE